MGRTLVAILCILLLVAVLVGSILAGPPNIVTPPEEMMLTVDELPLCWIAIDSHVDYPTRPVIPGVNWTAMISFRNESLDVIPALTIVIHSFNSSSLAHDEYMHGLKEDESTTEVDVGNEGYRLSGEWTTYAFRVRNIFVHIDFCIPYEPWMDEIVRLQESEIL